MVSPERTSTSGGFTLPLCAVPDPLFLALCLSGPHQVRRACPHWSVRLFLSGLGGGRSAGSRTRRG